MSPQTQAIIEGIVAIGLVVVLAYMLVKMYGGGGTGNGTHCQPGTYPYQGFCIGCENVSDCHVTKHGGCVNGGVWQPLDQTGTIGFCSCPAPYFGKRCEKECNSEIKCPTGTCQDGACISAKCKCPDGQTCAPGSSKCTKCLPGRGPGYPDCSKKLFNEPIVSGLPNCISVAGGYSQDSLKTKCKKIYGNSASVIPRSNAVEAFCGYGCAPGFGYRQCYVPEYYANSNFNPKNFNACKKTNKLNGYQQWLVAGGEPSAPYQPKA